MSRLFSIAGSFSWKFSGRGLGDRPNQMPLEPIQNLPACRRGWSFSIDLRGAPTEAPLRWMDVSADAVRPVALLLLQACLDAPQMALSAKEKTCPFGILGDYEWAPKSTAPKQPLLRNVFRCYLLKSLPLCDTLNMF